MASEGINMHNAHMHNDRKYFCLSHIEMWYKWKNALSPDAKQCVQCPDQEYPNSERNHCLPKIVTFLAFKDSLGMSLACRALWFWVITVVVLWVFVKHWDIPIVKANNWGLRCPAHLPPPVLPLLLTLHCPFQHSHLPPQTNYIWSWVYSGCFSQNPDCDSGIQGQETRKNHEISAGNRSF